MPAELALNRLAQESGNLWSADFQGICSFNFSPWNISVRFKHVTGGRNEPMPCAQELKIETLGRVAQNSLSRLIPAVEISGPFDSSSRPENAVCSTVARQESGNLMAGMEFQAFPNSTYHEASRIPSVYPSKPHPEIVGVSKPPSSNLYSMIDPNLIYATQSGAGVKNSKHLEGWVGEQFKPAHSSLRLSGVLDSFRPEKCRPNSVQPWHRNPAIYGQRISKEFTHSI
ncbi:hypothetical protein CEXT_162211 [Caerostris extrusa]|uniref:Uncharacterized protein n=1 Tax=Caerostris extrusa TaxID=172846 RepID=A0AAV4XCK7_CAEEX|nr:hypothetical protein CEXT_162211 [Caerostris extrusa]